MRLFSRSFRVATGILFLMLGAVAWGAEPGSGAVLDPGDILRLIEDERRKERAWLDADIELPQAHLRGDRGMVFLSGSGSSQEPESPLCGDFGWDEILSSGRAGREGVVLNTHLPRVQEILGTVCLVRPRDNLVAVGAGTQKIVTLQDFLLRKNRPRCPGRPSHSLWAAFSEELLFDPLFFSTDIFLPEGANRFRNAEDLRPAPLEDEARRALAEVVRFLDEYDGTVYQVGYDNCDRLVLLSRRAVALVDEGLPSALLLSEAGGVFRTLVSQTVGRERRSGSLWLRGVFDMHGDGLIDILVGGEQEGCPVSWLFVGTETGFEEMPFPQDPCGC